MTTHNTPQLIVFARAPVYGKVKTRLATDIGKTAALAFYQQTLDMLLDRLRHGPWHLSVATATAAEQSHPAFSATHTMAQPEGSLGRRMTAVLDQFPNTDRIIIGSDIPAITTSHILDAFDALLKHDVVFGPSCDGGFWLAGCRAAYTANSGFMNNVRWSTKHALADTARTLPAACKVAMVRTLADVDDGASYQQFLSEPGHHKHRLAIPPEAPNYRMVNLNGI